MLANGNPELTPPWRVRCRLPAIEEQSSNCNAPRSEKAASRPQRELQVLVLCSMSGSLSVGGRGDGGNGLRLGPGTFDHEPQHDGALPEEGRGNDSGYAIDKVRSEKAGEGDGHIGTAVDHQRDAESGGEEKPTGIRGCRREQPQAGEDFVDQITVLVDTEKQGRERSLLRLIEC